VQRHPAFDRDADGREIRTYVALRARR
jgi:hypothetical protein